MPYTGEYNRYTICAQSLYFKLETNEKYQALTLNLLLNLIMSLVLHILPSNLSHSSLPLPPLLLHRHTEGTLECPSHSRVKEIYFNPNFRLLIQMLTAKYCKLNYLFKEFNMYSCKWGQIWQPVSCSFAVPNSEGRVQKWAQMLPW